MKCYVGGHVDPFEYDFVAVCFAHSRAEAKRTMWKHSDNLQDECNGNWMSVRVVRKKEHDELFDKSKDQPYVVIDEKTLRLMGWRHEGDELCESCGLAEMGDAFPICMECYQCVECGHNDSCKYSGNTANEREGKR